MGSASGKSFDTMGSQKKATEEPFVKQDFDDVSESSRQLPMVRYSMFFQLCELLL
jgi:hypothetical protein